MRVYYLGESHDGPSPKIWADPKIQEVIKNPERGSHLWEDFLDQKAAVTTENTGRWTVLADASCGIAPVAVDGAGAAAISGIVQLYTSGSDEDQVYITPNNYAGTQTIFTINSGLKNAFEVRWMQDHVDTTNPICLILGLIETASLTATDTLTDATGVYALEKDLVAFNTLAASPDELDLICRDQANAIETEMDGGADLAYNTWQKAGWIFDGKKTLKVYFDNTLVATIDMNALDNLVEKPLIPVLGFKSTTAHAQYVWLDWVRSVQCGRTA